ncbi:DDRGK domain-containing protein 1 [Ischnura elegans]|uniref:DDRGK domain-containing protein 1 n=1 Tax=Ischnura elegans TaxID=197161 RepID=UPI001ED8BB9A|nr:DDRGK domain-containing protein 1 [Ischnura elegans]
MDAVSYTVLACVIVFLLLLFGFLFKSSSKREPEVAPDADARRGQEANLPRRAVAARNQRARLRPTGGGNQRQNVSDDENEDNEERERNIDLGDGKIGAKKRAKLEAKADRKVQREAEEREREEKKKREMLKEQEREKREERERQEEAAREEEERRQREEKERREQEEYERLKEAFSVEEEGFEENVEDEENNLLNNFITHIKTMKVVVLEDLASHFKMKTQAVIERIQQLQADGNLTGVIDDRGKFIYISPEELEAVAKFVRQRGRVSILELAESSNKLINLVPTKAEVAQVEVVK